MKDILQNNWPELFKNVSVMKNVFKKLENCQDQIRLIKPDRHIQCVILKSWILDWERKPDKIRKDIIGTIEEISKWTV